MTNGYKERVYNDLVDTMNYEREFISTYAADKKVIESTYNVELTLKKCGLNDKVIGLMVSTADSGSGKLNNKDLTSYSCFKLTAYCSTSDKYLSIYVYLMSYKHSRNYYLVGDVNTMSQRLARKFLFGELLTWFVYSPDENGLVLCAQYEKDCENVSTTICNILHDNM